MPAFRLETDLFDYFRRKAQELECNPCFDDKQEEIEAMNKEGANGIPNCLCRAKTPCPCKKGVREIQEDGICYCEIFKKV